MSKKQSKSTRVVTTRKSERVIERPEPRTPRPAKKESGADILRSGIKDNRFI